MKTLLYIASLALVASGAAGVFVLGDTMTALMVAGIGLLLGALTRLIELLQTEIDDTNLISEELASALKEEGLRIRKLIRDNEGTKQ